jgi:cell wall-associated NlpC family hydrolase
VIVAPEIEAAARAHAVKEWPNESCGIVTGGAYVPLLNEAPDPRETFRLPVRTFADYPVEAVVHSHCSNRHLPWPTAADMASQIETGVPWGIVWAGGDGAVGPLWWGDFVLNEDLIGREFQPGIRDCYSCIRAHRWQAFGIKLPEFPRDADWWNAGGDLLRKGFEPAGFHEVKDKPAPGDVLLMKIRAPVPNHCAVVLENGLVLHHLGNRVSRREPLGPWLRYVTHTLRYAGQERSP